MSRHEERELSAKRTPTLRRSGAPRANAWNAMASSAAKAVRFACGCAQCSVRVRFVSASAASVARWKSATPSLSDSSSSAAACWVPMDRSAARLEGMAMERVTTATRATDRALSAPIVRHREIRIVCTGLAVGLAFRMVEVD